MIAHDLHINSRTWLYQIRITQGFSHYNPAIGCHFTGTQDQVNPGLHLLLQIFFTAVTKCGIQRQANQAQGNSQGQKGKQ